MLTHPGLKHRLILAAGSSVATALQNGNPPTIAAPIDEPTAVAAITWVAMPDLIARWRPVLRPRFRIALHSVFCHQSPQVGFIDRNGAPQQCELADLLLVVDEVAGGKIQDRRAVFVQAKMFSRRGRILVPASVKDQLELYEFWHSFRFAHGPYAPVPRNFAATGQPGSSADSGRYGGIDLPPLAPLWEQIIPSTNPRMTRGSGIDLAEFVAGMIVGDAGIGRAAHASGRDDWSMTIDEILSITAAQSVTLQASFGPGNQPRRGVKSVALDVPTLLMFMGRPPPPDADGTVFGTGPDRGLSFVHVRLIAVEGDG